MNSPEGDDVGFSWSLNSPAPLPSRRDVHGRKRKSAAAPAPRAYDSAYPAGRVLVVVRPPVKKKTLKKRGSGILTMLAVVGLFGSVAIPAYAFAPKTDDEVTAEAAAGDTLSVSDDVAVSATERGNFTATTAGELRNQKRTSMMSANYATYMASGARELGDDYPWFSELSNNQGGGLSPLNYYYRECVDFVAWRLNRDAGSTTAPFKYDWSTLTPSGGNAYQWKYNWTKHGWPTSTTPVAGAVAWFSYNHVAYVKAVNADGSVTIEEYNGAGTHVYGIRVIAATDAQLYLYPPPR